jgi:tetratricopeptide (TPR) repeat protein
MELTIEQALQQGVAAHKEGKLEDAERLYRAILQSQPTHPDANHNLGVLAVSVNKADVALPLFKTALEANPKVEQFWLSYIDALVKANKLKDAKQAIKKAKKKGFDAKKLQALLSQLKEVADTKAPSQELLNSLLGHFQTGRYGDAEKLAISITQEFPKHHFGWKVLGAVLKETGRVIDSLTAMQKSVQLAPQDAEAHSNLGNTLQELGRLEEAEASCIQAIALKPDYAEAHSNLGNTLKELGRLDEAEASLQQAIALKPDFAEAHSNLGIMLKDLGRLDEAEASYTQAIALKPDYAEAHSNLGNTLDELGRLDEAIDAYMQALKINPDFTDAYSNMGIVLTNIEFRKPVPGLPELIYEILAKKKLVQPKDISKATTSLLKFDPVIKGTITKNSAGELVQSLQEIIVNLSNIPLLLKLMEICPIPDFELESLFKDIRSAILLSISRIKNNSEILAFQNALALHCFTNEYLYDQTELEIEALKKLENLVGNKLTAGEQPTPRDLACLASYKALGEYSWIQLVTVPVELQELERRQIIEPEKEKQLRSNIPMLQKINDNVSRKVREQYEQNPYPRWINTRLRLAPKPISALIKEINLNIKNPSINEISNPQILIAGCGTGLHSTETAARFKDCDVLAIDLSLSSLSYAKRKTEELGISNIEYMQADILELGALNRQFDIIESAGVLHHMDNPMAGWEVLTNCLKEGGLMKIGLYSELARSHIVQMRREIQQSNIGSSNDAMKSFRKMIVSSKEEHHNMIASSYDFYSLSEFRDLLFHVQEHRFTIPQIKDCLDQLGLAFCGFEADKTVQKFKSEYLSENAVYDLDRWDAFEKENPREFLGMYQFWCQKTV